MTCIKDEWCKKESCITSGAYETIGRLNKDYTTTFYCSICGDIFWVQPKDEIVDSLLHRLDNFDLLKQIHQNKTLEFAESKKGSRLTHEERMSICELADQYYEKEKNNETSNTTINNG